MKELMQFANPFLCKSSFAAGTYFVRKMVSFSKALTPRAISMCEGLAVTSTFENICNGGRVEFWKVTVTYLRSLPPPCARKPGSLTSISSTGSRIPLEFKISLYFSVLSDFSETGSDDIVPNICRVLVIMYSMLLFQCN